MQTSKPVTPEQRAAREAANRRFSRACDRLAEAENAFRVIRTPENAQRLRSAQSAANAAAIDYGDLSYQSLGQSVSDDNSPPTPHPVGDVGGTG